MESVNPDSYEWPFQEDVNLFDIPHPNEIKVWDLSDLDLEDHPFDEIAANVMSNPQDHSDQEGPEQK